MVILKTLTHLFIIFFFFKLSNNKVVKLRAYLKQQLSFTEITSFSIKPTHNASMPRFGGEGETPDGSVIAKSQFETRSFHSRITTASNYFLQVKNGVFIYLFITGGFIQ